MADPTGAAGKKHSAFYLAAKKMLDVRPYERRTDGTVKTRVPPLVRTAAVSTASFGAVKAGMDISAIPDALTYGLPEAVANNATLPEAAEAAAGVGAAWGLDEFGAAWLKEGAKKLMAKMAGAPSDIDVEFAKKPRAIPGKALVGEVSDATLTKVFEEVAPFIRHDTGWDFDATKVGCKVISTDELVQAMIEQTEADMGTTVSASEREELGQLSKMALGVYLPSRNQFVLNGGLLKNVSGDALYDVVFHEGVHAAQHQQHPGFFEAVKAQAKELQRATEEFGKESPRAKAEESALQAMMSLVEGHPTFLQTHNRPNRFPESRMVGSKIVAGSARPLFSRDARQQLQRYIYGSKVVEHVSKTSDPAHAQERLEELYENPALVKILFQKERATFQLEVPADKTVEEYSSQLAILMLGLKSKAKIELCREGKLQATLDVA